MKIKFFHPHSPLFPFRWFILFALVVAGFLSYANISGWRLLSFSNQEQWRSSGPGYHK